MAYCKNILLAASLLSLFCSGLSAQSPYKEQTQDEQYKTERRNRIFFEFGSTSNVLGVGYERQIARMQPLLFRTGASYISNYYSFHGMNNENERTEINLNDYYVSVPVGLTYLLFPEHRAHIELGAGLIGCLQFVQEQDVLKIVKEQEEPESFFLHKHNSVEYMPLDKRSKTLFKAFSYLNFGYRFEADNGFMVRTGFSALGYFDTKSLYFGSCSDLFDWLLPDADLMSYGYCEKEKEPGIYLETIQIHRRTSHSGMSLRMGIYFGIGYSF